MSLKFKNGDSVVQVMPAPISGVVARFVFDEISGEISYVVNSVDSDGVAHERVFSANDLQAVEPAPIKQAVVEHAPVEPVVAEPVALA
jgi:hypothetical protein